MYGPTQGSGSWRSGRYNVALSPKICPSIRSDGQNCLLATANIRENEVLITYDGPVIDHPTRYSIQIDDDKHIEGTPESNAYLNHSCAPNAYVDWNGVYLRALRSIEAGEEITCNYLTTDWELHEKFVCHCGAPDCYGELKGPITISRSTSRAVCRRNISAAIDIRREVMIAK